VVKFGFYPTKLKKQPFFANNSKICPPFRIISKPAPPSDAHGPIYNNRINVTALGIITSTAIKYKTDTCTYVILL